VGVGVITVKRRKRGSRDSRVEQSDAIIDPGISLSSTTHIECKVTALSLVTGVYHKLGKNLFATANS